MNNTFSLILSFIALSLITVSCDKQQNTIPEEEQKQDTVSKQSLVFDFGQYSKEADGRYKFQTYFLTSLTPPCQEVMFEVMFDRTVLSGEFSVENGTISSGSYIRDISANWEPYNSRGFSEGKLIIDANGMSFVGKDKNGQQYNFVCTNPISWSDQTEDAWKHEPVVPTTVVAVIDSGIVSNEGKEMSDYANDMWLQGMSKTKDYGIVFDFMVDLSTTNRIPEGVYPVSSTGEPNTLMQSHGLVYYEGMEFVGGSGSLVGTIENNSWTNIYYIVSGSATVRADGFTFSGNSHFGSQLTVTYTGDMSPR